MSTRRGIIACLAAAFGFFPATECLAILVCPDGEIMQGVDVCHWQGSVEWSQVAASGVAFAYARVSDGLLFIDPAFAGNYEGIKAAGMIRGAYQMFRPGQDPLDQANLVLSSVGTIGPGDLPPALDVEVTDGRSPLEIGHAVQVWVSVIQQATGRTPVIFTGRYFWDDLVISPDSAREPLWIAAWGVTCPNTPSIWNDWVLWQYTNSGSVPGIGGGVARDEFNGSLSDLQALAGMSPVGLPDVSVTKFAVYRNQPNPFNPRTTIRFDLPDAGRVRLAVYDVAGRLIRTLVDADLPRGTHEEVWDGRDEAGQAVASGSYFAKLNAGARAETIRMSRAR
jgi:GH25 family lysozyme M1 (1,4-beta-N-acetylmuramidase)